MRKYRFRKEPLADVNLTNLIDIMLVLLIVFILVANFVQTGLNINLPQVTYVESTGQERIVIGIDADGNYTINNQPVGAEYLEQQLRDLKEQFPDEAVFIMVDRQTYAEDLMWAASMVRSVGFTQVNFPLELLRRS